MPGKSKAYRDEYESDDFEQTDTLIGRNRVPVSSTKKKSRPTSATKNRTPRRPVTPGKKKRPKSAPSAKTGHDLWMNAVKKGLTVGLASNRHPSSPRHKTPSEYWIETLRRTGQGFTTESTGMNTFSGKRPRDKDMPYLSTPHHLRRMVGTERGGGGADPTAKAVPGTPNYKSQEEYYEQVLEYKKQVSSMNQDAATMKAKIRRLEEDNLKKEKEIDSLLHPHKSEEVRRTLADKRPDSGSMVHSLKQKILKLETQLRDKEASYIKLQSDLKTTKIEELKQQLEVFYQEIVRLQNSKDTGIDKSARGLSKDGTVKIKALNETILRLNRSNEQLQNENRGLKEDLKNSMDTHRDNSISKEYEDMNTKELLRTISQLERRAEKAERYGESSSVISYDTKQGNVQGKIALEGSLEHRLDQLDKRENELLGLLEKKNDKIKQLTDEKNRWKRRCDDLENMLTSGHGDHYEHVTDSKIEKSRQKSPSVTRNMLTSGHGDHYEHVTDSKIEKSRQKSPSVTSRPPSSRPLSARRERPPSARSESERPPSARDRSGSRVERPLSGRTEKGSRPTSAPRRRSSIDSGVSSVRRQRIKDFKENRSAKTIQRNWRSHQQNKKAKERAVEKNSLPGLGNKASSDKKVQNALRIHQYLEENVYNMNAHGASHDHGCSHVTPSSNMIGATAKESYKPKAQHKNNGNSQSETVPADRAKQESDQAKLDNEKVEHFRENLAAKRIQRNWTGYQYRKQEHERDEASELIRSALMGHSIRQRQMQRPISDYEDNDETDDEEYNECVNLIQSAMLGHNTRKSHMREHRFSSAGEDDYDEDDDIMSTPRHKSVASLRSSNNRPTSGRSRGSSGSFSKGSVIKSGTTFNKSHSSSYVGDDDDF